MSGGSGTTGGRSGYRAIRQFDSMEDSMECPCPEPNCCFRLLVGNVMFLLGVAARQMSWSSYGLPSRLSVLGALFVSGDGCALPLQEFADPATRYRLDRPK